MRGRKESGTNGRQELEGGGRDDGPRVEPGGRDDRPEVEPGGRGGRPEVEPGGRDDRPGEIVSGTRMRRADNSSSLRDIGDVAVWL